MENYELYHHGILGMKWGVRRTEAQLARARGKKNEASEDYNNAHTKKNVKSMSNKELKDRIARLQMEKQYSQLTAKEKSSGLKFVTDVLSGAAKQTATNYVSKYMSKGVEAFIKKVTA